MAGTEATTAVLDAGFDVINLVLDVAEGGVTTDEIIDALPDGPLKDALLRARTAGPALRSEIVDLDLAEGAGLGAHALARLQDTLRQQKRAAAGL